MRSRQKEACAQRLTVCKVRHLYRGRGSVSWEMGGGGTHNPGTRKSFVWPAGMWTSFYNRQAIVFKKEDARVRTVFRKAFSPGHDSEREFREYWNVERLVRWR